MQKKNMKSNHLPRVVDEVGWKYFQLITSLQNRLEKCKHSCGPNSIGKKISHVCTADQTLLVRRHFVIEMCVLFACRNIAGI